MAELISCPLIAIQNVQVSVANQDAIRSSSHEAIVICLRILAEVWQPLTHGRKPWLERLASLRFKHIFVRHIRRIPSAIRKLRRPFNLYSTLLALRCVAIIPGQLHSPEMLVVMFRKATLSQAYDPRFCLLSI